MEVKARDAGACADGSTFTIPGVEGTFCKKCSEMGEAPINGKCETTTAVTGATCADGVCTGCGTGNYFLFEGGCYDQTQEPGSKLCKTAASGQCTAKADKIEGVFVKDGKLYLCSDDSTGGVESCGTCSKCLDSYFPNTTDKTCKDATTCSECLEGYHWHWGRLGE
ncbi:High cysteine protein [Giardia muris]|uniref:High cysteine protein n=1 Tax=Giardia muris TaxID=5742 RepID=A0A4Z1SYK3_GIAMU|nr:High cysteine protein [Giardia muris]|eukprot:TNJ29855.1 High cysteine protein [Giardia muris]